MTESLERKPGRRQWMMHPGPEAARRSAEIAEENEKSAKEVSRLEREITPVMERGEKHAGHVARAHALRDQALQKRTETTALPEDHPSGMPDFPQTTDDKGHLKPGTSADFLRPVVEPVGKVIRTALDWIRPKMMLIRDSLGVPPIDYAVAKYVLRGDMEEFQWHLKNVSKWPSYSIHNTEKAEKLLSEVEGYLEHSRVLESEKGTAADTGKLKRIEWARGEIEKVKTRIRNQPDTVRQ